MDFKIINGVLKEYTGNDSYIVIPEGVTEIGQYVFEGNTNLRSVKFPTSLITISFCAFSGCTGLTQLDFPKRLEYIYNHAFDGCTGLTELYFPPYSYIGVIGPDAFRDCTGLRRVTVSQRYVDSSGVHGLDYIRSDAFEGCINLETVTVPKVVRGLFNSNLKKAFGKRYKEISFHFTDTIHC